MNWKRYQKAYWPGNLDISNELKLPFLSFESFCVAKIRMNYYNTVVSSKNSAYKISHKMHKKQ